MGVPKGDEQQDNSDDSDPRPRYVVESDGGSDDAILGGAGTPRHKRDY